MSSLKNTLLIGSLLLTGGSFVAPVIANDSTPLSSADVSLSEAHILARLDSITVDDFNIRKTTLSQALDHFDSVIKPYGLQVIFQPIEGSDPAVNIKTRKLSLSRNLTLMCQQGGYSWTVENGVIMVATPGSGEPLETQLIPIKSTTARRLAASQGVVF